LVAEFGAEVQYADFDNAILKAPGYFSATTTYELNEDGHLVLGQMVSRAVADGMSSVDPRQTAMDRHDKRSQGVAEWTFPEGAPGTVALATHTKKWTADDYYMVTAFRGTLNTAGSTATTVDLLLGVNNGTPASIYTTTANRMSFGSAVTAVSAILPDKTVVYPGDTVVVQVTAAGTSAANLRVILFAKKISPP
jgi:hypothetical protein